MGASLNKVCLIGALGKDPEARSFSNGGQVVSFSLATSESWKDKNSGEKKEKTQWHRVAIFNERLGDVATKYLKKGARVYLEGAIETRKYTDNNGAEREITEVVLARYRGELTILDNKRSDEGPGPQAQAARAPQQSTQAAPDLDDDIPF